MTRTRSKRSPTQKSNLFYTSPSRFPLKSFPFQSRSNSQFSSSYSNPSQFYEATTWRVYPVMCIAHPRIRWYQCSGYHPLEIMMQFVGKVDFGKGTPNYFLWACIPSERPPVVSLWSEMASSSFNLYGFLLKELELDALPAHCSLGWLLCTWHTQETDAICTSKMHSSPLCPAH